jgi:hypothetical protein
LLTIKNQAMAISVYFKPAKLNAGQYENCMKNLDKAGVGTPEGRLYHTCIGSGDQLQVFEIWDSQGSFDKFSTVMQPIVKAEGIDPGQPMIQPVLNTIQGNREDWALRAA